MASIIVFFLNDKKLSSNMSQISEHINSSNHQIYSHDQMRKFIVNLGNRKFKNNNNSTCQLSRLHNSLFISILDTPEKYISNIDRKIDNIKIRTSSIKSS